MAGCRDIFRLGLSAVGAGECLYTLLCASRLLSNDTVVPFVRMRFGRSTFDIYPAGNGVKLQFIFSNIDYTAFAVRSRNCGKAGRCRTVDAELQG